MRTGSVVVTVHPGRVAGPEHPRRDVVAIQRQAQAVGQLLQPVPVKYGERDECIIGVVSRDRRVAHMQASSHLVGDRAEHLRRVGPPRYHCRNPSQRGLLIGEHTQLVAAGL